MKTIILLLGILLSGKVSSQLRVEWLQELQFKPTMTGGNGQVVVSENTLLRSITPAGNTVWQEDLLNSSNDLFIFNNRIYSAGFKLKALDLSGNIVSETSLYSYPKPPVGSPPVLNYKSRRVGNYFYCMDEWQYIYKYDLDGKFQWRVMVDSNAENLHFTATGNGVYVYSAMGWNCISKYDTSGALVWRKSPGMLVDNILSDEEGNFYLMAVKKSPEGSKLVAKYNSDAELIWESYHPLIKTVNGIFKGDSLILCGGAWHDSLRKSALRIISVSTGSPYGEHYFNIDPYAENPEWFETVAFVNNEFYCGGGYMQQKHFLVKLSDPLITGIARSKDYVPEINVFPNPSSSVFNIHIKENTRSETNWRVFNSVGQMVKDGAHNSLGAVLSIDLSTHPKGVYFLKLYNGKQRTVHKLVRD